MTNYKIIEILNDVSGKFVALVSFNGREAERYEIESLDPIVIGETLTSVNSEVVDTDETIAVSQAQASAVSIDANGQIII